MELITRQQRIDTVAARWKWQHLGADGVWKGHNGSYDPKDVYNRLVELPGLATPEDVSGIIGNSSFIDVTCTFCRAKVDRAVMVDAYQCICPTCISVAASIAEVCNG